jgi:ATP-dependent DNA ligase
MLPFLLTGHHLVEFNVNSDARRPGIVQGAGRLGFLEPVHNITVMARAATLAFIKPCLAQDVSTPTSGEQWVHEIKFDGIRGIE